MIRLLWRSDLHMADQAPRSRVDNWSETLLGKVSQIEKLCHVLKADAVIDGGDLFHVKTPTRNSHNLVERVARAHKGYPCPVYVVPGNHDCKHGDYHLLGESPLGVLYSSGCFQRLYDEHEAVFRDSRGVTVRVVGVPYHGTKYDLDRFRTLKKGSEDWLVVAAHLLASEGGGSFFEGEDILRYGDLVDLDPDLYFFGHWHKNQGVKRLTSSEGKTRTFVNVGSLSRGSLSEDDVSRQPLVLVVDFKHDQITWRGLGLEVLPVHEVFDLGKRTYEESRAMSVEDFVRELHDTMSLGGSTSLLDLVRALSEEREDVKERAIACLEKAGAT